MLKENNLYKYIEMDIPRSARTLKALHEIIEELNRVVELLQCENQTLKEQNNKLENIITLAKKNLEN
jgi:DNA repair ATPase RecN